MPKRVKKTLYVASSVREVTIDFDEHNLRPVISNRGKDVVLHFFLPDALHDLLGVKNPKGYTFSLKRIVEESDGMSAKEQLAIIRGLEEIVEYLKRDHAEYEAAEKQPAEGEAGASGSS